MENEILKPMSVVRTEFIGAMTELINNCMLPPFVIEGVLKDMLHEIHILSNRQLEIDTKQYQEQLSLAGARQERCK